MSSSLIGESIAIEFESMEVLFSSKSNIEHPGNKRRVYKRKVTDSTFLSFTIAIQYKTCL